MPDSNAAPLCHQFALALTGKRTFTPAALDQGQSCIQDFLASVFSTQQFPWVRQAQAVARANSATKSGGALLLGTPHRVSMQDAAFANAVAGHSLVRDDMHVGSVSHLGVVVLPAAIAMAEHTPVSGRQLLEAVICGYEAGARLGTMLMDVDTARTFRPTGLIGAFAAAATCARLADLDTGLTANALSFAANYLTGLNEWAAWGSEDMYFHPGIAVRNGITAMQLAREGATASKAGLEGGAGLFSALGKAIPDASLLPSFLPFSDGEEILKVFFKQVPACNYAQTAAQAALGIRKEHGIEFEHIGSLSIAVPHAAAHYPGCDYKGPFHSILQARMSIYFNVASTLLNGSFDDAHYHDYASPDIMAIISKASLVIDDTMTARYPERQGAGITLTMDDGNTFNRQLDDVIAADVQEVARRFQKAASALLGKNAGSALAETLATLQDSDNPDRLFALLSTSPRP